MKSFIILILSILLTGAWLSKPSEQSPRWSLRSWVVRRAVGRRRHQHRLRQEAGRRGEVPLRVQVQGSRAVDDGGEGREDDLHRGVRDVVRVGSEDREGGFVTGSRLRPRNQLPI